MKCGIDLGTMFSAIAFCDSSSEKLRIEEIVLAEADSGTQVRSALYFAPDGKVVVGSSALNMLTSDGDRVVQWIKIDMGEDSTRTFDEKTWTPPQISAEILKVLKKNAETWMDSKLEGAVICVPAWFGDRQREATRQAAEIAEIPLIELLAEPSAAALAVTLERGVEIADREILVYDLGGGTFDVVLIRTRKNSSGRMEVETLSLAGDRKLGGHNWDLALARHLSAQCKEKFDFDPEYADDRRDWYFLLDQCEKNKREFSKGVMHVTIPCDLRGHTLTVSLEEFNEVTESLLDTTGSWVDVVLKEAEDKHGVKRDNVAVLLCGGSSKLPGVRPLLTRIVGHEPLHLPRTNPELLVVRGAAYAAHLADHTTPAEKGPAGPAIVFSEKYKAVGVEVVLDDPGDQTRYGNELVLSQGVAANEPKTKSFAIAEDNQTELEIPILQGENADADLCERIGSLVVRNLPQDRKAGGRVDVTIWYDAKGILQCKAVDFDTKAEAQISVQR